MTTIREQQVLELIREDPMTSQQALAERLGISRSAVAGHIMRLTNKGIIKGRGYVVSDAPFIAVIGGANMDIHGKPVAALRRHDSNPGAVHMSPGGVARNIAENLARLGADCRLISAVGNDQHGLRLLQQGRDAGIDMQHVQQLDSAPTATYLSVVERSGEMDVAINDMAIFEELGPDRLQSQEAMLKQASLIILDSNLRDDSLAWLVNASAGRPLFVDTVSAAKAGRIEPHLGAIHTLKTSLAEAEALTGLPARTQAARRRLASWVHDKGVARLFVTLGKDGVFYSTEDAVGIERTRGGKRMISNTGGAGDAFMAGIAYAWIKSWPLLKSVRFALVAAEVTLSARGTSSPALSLAAVNRVYRRMYAG